MELTIKVPSINFEIVDDGTTVLSEELVPFSITGSTENANIDTIDEGLRSLIIMLLRQRINDCLHDTSCNAVQVIAELLDTMQVMEVKQPPKRFGDMIND